MKENAKQDFRAYDAPNVQFIEICPEQCLASSCSLDDMENNEVYDEEF